MRHAGATEVGVCLSLVPKGFVITIKDNGRGFDGLRSTVPDSARIASGNGLLNMQRRLAEIGGRCEIASNCGEGSCVSFVVGVSEPIGPILNRLIAEDATISKNQAV